MQEVLRLNGKNSEGYPDPTAEKAIRAAGRLPTHVYNVLKVLNDAAGLMGYEVIGIRDRKTGKEWRR